MIEINNVYNLDCLEGLKLLDSESIDVIYLDPPFFTQKKQKLTDKNGKEYSFNDTWKNIDEYIAFLEERFVEMKRVLKNTGTIFVHCDKSAAHYIRCTLDKVFGMDKFQSEIIWKYKRWSNAKKGLLDSHQNIYFYSKTKDYKFNFIYEDYSSTTNIDQIYQSRKRDSNGKTVYNLDDNGNPIHIQKKGVPLCDVWDIPYLNPKAKERCGYPTQKPILLIDRILEISSNEGDLILDPFCGSGTTLVSAKMNKRNFIGFDINREACQLTNNRLNDMIKSESHLLKSGRKSYETKNEFEKEILSHFDCDIVQRNKGLDAILRKTIEGSMVGIKIQKENESLEDSIDLLIKAMNKRGFKKSILVATKSYSITTEIPDNIVLIKSLEAQLETTL